MTKRIALVTGGTRGLGLAAAARLAERGMIVLAGYRADGAAAAAAAARLQAIEPACDVIQGDVSSEADAARMVQAATDRFGQLDVLVHSAFRSGRPPAKTHELDAGAFREDLETNLTGAFLVAKAALQPMVDQSAGRLIFIGSIAARGEPGRLAYTVAKNGIVGLMKTIAAEYARQGITANVVNPGFMTSGAFLRLPEDIQTRALKMVPARRAGTEAEFAEAVWYFAAPDAGFTTGQVLSVAGGVAGT